MNKINRYNLCIGDITQGGAVCANPTIIWESNSPNVVIPCDNEGSCNCVEVQVLVDDSTDSIQECINIIIDCEDCEKCPPQIITKCICGVNDDCGACQDCIGSICTPSCDPDKKCDEVNDACVDCLGNGDCTSGEECISGSCDCPVDKPYKDDSGSCVACLDNTITNPCETCVNGSIIPVSCSTGVCDPDTSDCVECNNAGDCGNNQVCIGKECVCGPGYIYDPVTKDCIVAPECITDGDCGECKVCMIGNCEPVSCPENQVCVLGNCEQECYTFNDCKFGYYCDNQDNLCKSCNNLSCDAGECENIIGCDCMSSECIPTSEEVYRCEAEVTEQVEGCIEVVMMIDQSGSMGTFEEEVESEVNIFSNKVVDVNADSKIGFVTYSDQIGVVSNLSNVANSINLQPGGCTNYTEGLDVSIGMLKNSSSNCRKFIVFFTDGSQNTASAGPFIHTGLSPTGASTTACAGGGGNLEDNLAITMTDYARSIGIEVKVIAFGPVMNPALLQAMGGGSVSNIFPAPVFLVNQAFGDVFDNISNIVIEPAGCVPAELDWAGETFSNIASCEDSCGIKFYSCTPEGCKEDPNGAYLAGECIDNCSPSTMCSCDGGECTPQIGATSGVDCANCTDACFCGQFSVDVSYDCSTNTVDASITGGSGAGFIVDISEADGTTVGTYNLVELQDLSLMSKSYILTFTDTGNSTCTSTNSLTVACCGTLSVTGKGVEVCGGDDASLDFTILNGISPYTYEISDASTGEIICTGTATEFPNNTTGSNASCTVTPTSDSIYNISVEDASGCIDVSSVNVNVRPVFQVNATGHEGICTTKVSQDITFTTTSTNAPYVYSLLRGNVVVVPGVSSSSDSYVYTELSPSNGIQYTMKVEDAGGCVVTETFSMTTQVCQDCILSSNISDHCGKEGRDINATIVSGAAPFTYTVIIDGDVNHPNNTTGTQAAIGDITYFDNVLVSHSVTFRVMDANGSTCTNTTNINVEEYGSEFEVVCLNCNDSLCIGDTVNFTTSGGYLSSTYEWYQGPNANITNPASIIGTGSTFSTVLNSSQISVHVVSRTVGCPLERLEITATDNNCPVCDLVSTGIIQAGADLMATTTGCTTGASYSWTASSGGVITGATNTETITTNSTGVYTVLITCDSGVQMPCEASSVYSFIAAPCSLSFTTIDTTSSPCTIIADVSTIGTCTGTIEYRYSNSSSGFSSGWIPSSSYSYNECCGNDITVTCTPCNWTVEARCSTNTSCTVSSIITARNCIV